jgi:hypothetical protein
MAIQRELTVPFDEVFLDAAAESVTLDGPGLKGPRESRSQREGEVSWVGEPSAC